MHRTRGTASFSCSIFSISTARLSARSRSRSGRSTFGRCCRGQARRCNSAITRSGGGGFLRAGVRVEARRDRLEEADAPYAPGNRGLWLKVKWLNRKEFVVVGWTDPEGARPFLGALLLGYSDPDGRLIYAGRAGTGIGHAELERLWRRLQPLATPKMPLDVPPPRSRRFR